MTTKIIILDNTRKIELITINQFNYNMDLCTVPEEYCPAVSGSGVYYDKIPPGVGGRGLRGACTGLQRQYSSKSGFRAHCKSKGHIAWLAQLNSEHKHYYRLLQDANRVVEQQRLIIAQLSLELSKRAQPAPLCPVTTDLISFVD